MELTLRTARQGFLKTFAVSLMVHLLLLSAGLFIYRPGAKRTFIAPVYTVNLVGALKQDARPEADGPRAAAAEPIGKIAKTAAKEALEAPARETARVNLKALPASTDDGKAKKGQRGSVDEALKRIAKLVERKEAKALVSSSVEGMKRKMSSGALSEEVEEIKRAVGGKTAPGKAKGGAGAGLKAGPSGGGITRSSLEEARLLAYYTAVVDRVQGQWYVAGDPAGKGASVVVSVKIGRKGELLECFIEKSSGSRSFDESLVSAVRKAAPFPPLPDGFAGEFLDTGLRYCPGCGE